MRTSISLSDELHASADSLAEKLGISRSALYQRAIAEYVAKYEGREVTSKLDKVYDGRIRRLTAAQERATNRILASIEW